MICDSILEKFAAKVLRRSCCLELRWPYALEASKFCILKFFYPTLADFKINPGSSVAKNLVILKYCWLFRAYEMIGLSFFFCWSYFYYYALFFFLFVFLSSTSSSSALSESSSYFSYFSPSPSVSFICTLNICFITLITLVMLL